jgi:hypothetical protein
LETLGFDAAPGGLFLFQEIEGDVPQHREAGYFQDNYRHMQYLETREEGFPIGSGMVESACKQFRARLAGSGMRWSRAGLERLLPIRAAIMSQRFDELWQIIYHLPRN